MAQAFPQPAQNTDNLSGILWMLFSMATFAAGDVGIKLLAGVMPPGQIMGSLGLLGTALFAAWTKARGLTVLPPALLHPAVAMRYISEIVAGCGMVLALTLTPLSLVTAILQAAPLVVAMGAALVFGERVGWRRWSAILIGLAGVLIILRPGLAGFDPNAIWAVIAMLGLASRDLATRACPKSLSSLQLSTFGISALIPTGAILLVFTGAPVAAPLQAWAILLGTILATLVGYYAITAAMRVGEVAAVTPFRYSRLIFGLILGIAIFAERPDAATYLGAALILGTGLYSAWREHRARATLPRC
ncbi:DMT family transporter [Alterinioella nitratireducens]|uniref:DMT family transporter n=1 Tax=Alterinioella nitratireducens TaxID=2735915 RepID=UPI0040595DE8